MSWLKCWLKRHHDFGRAKDGVKVCRSCGRKQTVTPRPRKAKV